MPAASILVSPVQASLVDPGCAAHQSRVSKCHGTTRTRGWRGCSVRMSAERQLLVDSLGSDLFARRRQPAPDASQCVELMTEGLNAPSGLAKCCMGVVISTARQCLQLAAKLERNVKSTVTYISVEGRVYKCWASWVGMTASEGKRGVCDAGF